jgi:hypothetical protein
MDACCKPQSPQSRENPTTPAAQAKDDYGFIGEISCLRPDGKVNVDVPYKFSQNEKWVSITFAQRYWRKFRAENQTHLEPE